jgi:hypothetical protein
MIDGPLLLTSPPARAMVGDDDDDRRKSRFSRVAARAAAAACDTQGLESYRLEAAFVLAVRRLSIVDSVDRYR